MDLVLSDFKAIQTVMKGAIGIPASQEGLIAAILVVAIQIEDLRNDLANRT